MSALKYPTDLWIYQEIMAEVRPSTIIETGTWMGGSALFFAGLCDLLGQGRVLTIDVERRRPIPEHPRLTFLQGSSTAPKTLATVREHVGEGGRVLVVLDSDHSYDHVLEELRLYGPMVTPGSHLIVEDTNVNGNPVLPSWGAGPMEAVSTFLGERDDFVADRLREELISRPTRTGSCAVSLDAYRTRLTASLPRTLGSPGRDRR